MGDYQFKESKMDEQNKEIKLPKEFKGYISSFGASLIQSGLLPTVAFFEDENANSQSDRSKIAEIIFDILNIGDSYEKNKLLDYLIKNKENEKEIKEDIKNIAIALKLAMRTFKFDDKEK
ncbi:hypothetical protein CFSAN001627_07407 [Clostridium botulinum CFSAN001627]|uniref:CRISPR type III-B/RAMP module-associated protein Cmr5 n=2 Tax=Clostridium botulinum TaxID=1491 RepID=M1ZYE6_CLOBO|nr:hypothetical protein CFSAN001627_07407 [Clostridium botulinum CFSAN001627]